ncbi:MAG: hypothetical protein WEB59_09960 [Thermoanaerobaculia bacterium]
MRPCPRPLDPIDAEAVAAGADPVFAADAATHARECPPCQGLIGAARGLSEALRGVSEAPEVLAAGLAERVCRLRTFSRKERRTYAFWKAPILMTVALVAGGVALLALPSLTASDQMSAGAAALAPLLALARSVNRSVLDLARLAPSGLQALSDGMRQESRLGLLALALLVPLAFGLHRVLARVPGRR